MDIIIWGTAVLAKCCAEKLRDAGIDVACFVDNNKSVQGMLFLGKPVLSYEEFLEKYPSDETCILICAQRSSSIYQILEGLKDTRYRNIGVVSRIILSENCYAQLDIAEDNQCITWKRYQGVDHAVISHIEVNLIDGCNLNCQACNHLASLYDKKSIYPFERYAEDLLQLRKAGKLFRLCLLGGEPLLIENLHQYLSYARGLFPETNIELLTNGLLIPKISWQVLESIHKEHVMVSVTLYPPTVQIKDRISETLNKRHIAWRFVGDEMNSFVRLLTLSKTHDPYKSSSNCLPTGCAFLRNGKLFKCALDGLFEEFCQYYHLDIAHEAGIDIHSESVNLAEAAKNLALHPVETCCYCAEEPEMIPWGVKADPCLEDWLYQGN